MLYVKLLIYPLYSRLPHYRNLSCVNRDHWRTVSILLLSRFLMFQNCCNIFSAAEGFEVTFLILRLGTINIHSTVFQGRIWPPLQILTSGSGSQLLASSPQVFLSSSNPLARSESSFSSVCL